jgi:DNA polymerase III alpha subunit
MDIDIDLQTKFDPTKVFDKIIPASMVKDGELQKHPCGHYLQSIPVDPHTDLAAIPYEEAEALGYFKIDLLHLSVLDHFASKQEIRTLLTLEPNWDILLNEQHVQKLFQVHRQSRLLARIRPRSVQELADCTALIRPGKRHLIDDYLKDRDTVREKELYTKDKEGYTFKRSHAIAYAMTIVLQLHLVQLEVL